MHRVAIALLLLTLAIQAQPRPRKIFISVDMAKLGSLQPYRVTAPIDLEVGFKLTIDAERAAFVPGLSRSDAHN